MNIAAKSPAKSAKIERSFRDLSDEEARDPELLASLASFGWSTAFDWPELSKSPRVMLLSEAGTGKTFECQRQVADLVASGIPAFFIPLEALARESPDQLWSSDEATRFVAWHADGASTAHFFLDSIDEMQLSHGKFRTALRRLARAIDGQTSRARIVVTSRPIAIDGQAFRDELPIPSGEGFDYEIVNGEDHFEDLMTGAVRKAKRDAEKDAKSSAATKPWRTVALMPLSNEQIEAIIDLQGVTDGAALLKEIDRRRMWDFARRPQDLIEISAYWKEHKALGNRAQQIAQNITTKLRERDERTAYSHLAEARAREGAERLALALALTRKRTIRVSDHSLDDQESEVALDARIVLEDWSDAERNELLQRPLFGFASYGRVRFHHRSVAEYLAAQRLHHLVAIGRMPIAALLRLMVGEKYGQSIVFPAIRPVAAWLALSNDHVREALIAREPEALMDDGDPESFPLAVRQRVLTAFAERYGAGGWRGIHIPIDQVRRFADPGLSPTIRTLWASNVENADVKELLIDLVQAGRMSDCLDIAHAIAVDADVSFRDRVTAIEALAEMETPERFRPVIDAILDPVKQWPSSLKGNVLDTLFPKHLSVDQFCTLLSQIEVNDREICGLDWHLPRIVASLALEPPTRTQLRDGVAGLILGATEPCKEWPLYTSKFDHLSKGLAVLCVAELQASAVPSTALLAACVAASRFLDREYGDEKPVQNLRRHFQEAPPAVRAAAYQAENKFCLAHLPTIDGWRHRFNVTHHSLVSTIGDGDFDWLVAGLADRNTSPLEREAMFHLLLPLCRNETGWDADKRQCVATAIADDQSLHEKFKNSLKPPERDLEHEKMEKKWAAQKRANARKGAKRIADWQRWRRDMIADPAPFFASAKLAGTVHDFWHVLETDDHDLGSRTHWNKQTIGDAFNAEIADHAETAFKAYWRTLTVPLRSERKPDDRNSYLYVWLYGLAGVSAEAQSGSGWADGLTSAEAELAARYVPLELNGLPAWTVDLVARWPAEADAILGAELSRQLDAAKEFEHPDLLSDFSHAADEIQRFFAPRIWSWLKSCDCAIADETEQRRLHTHLDKAIAMRLRFGSAGNDGDLADLAIHHLASGLVGPFALLWLNALFRIHPSEGINMLDSGLSTLPPVPRYAFAESFFASLGEHRGVSFGPDLSNDAFSAYLLLRLLQLGYREIARENDINRAGSGAYRSSGRDDAQRGRDTVLSAFLGKSGNEAWNAKIAMTRDPLFAHFKDRMAHVARERVAAEAEGPALVDRDLRQLDQYGEAPPADRDGMFAMMMDRIDDLRHDLVHEFSERALLATISDETVMQSSLAKRLNEKANTAYRIDREAEVVGGKKTDIRLMSVRSDSQAVIELKLGDKGRSAKDLLNALRDQLVGQYMKHDNCRAGCLLVTLARTRTWRHPDTGATLDFDGLIDFLNESAQSISAELGHAIRLSAAGLDLRPSV